MLTGLLARPEGRTSHTYHRVHPSWQYRSALGRVVLQTNRAALASSGSHVLSTGSTGGRPPLSSSAQRCSAAASQRCWWSGVRYASFPIRSSSHSLPVSSSKKEERQSDSLLGWFVPLFCVCWSSLHVLFWPVKQSSNDRSYRNQICLWNTNTY